MNKMDSLYLAVRNRAVRAKDSIKEFMTAERGVSNVVATIIILLIVVLLIALFWGRLKEWLNNMMNTIFGTEFTTEGMDGLPE